MLSDLLVASDCGKVSVLTLLDLSAAFDTIAHHIVLDRLQNYFGISGSAFNWFQSYLSDRQQIISVNSIQSDLVVLQFGVPQGLVLRLILFALYIQPLTHILQSHHMEHQLFADDTQLHRSSKPSDIDQTASGVQDWVCDIEDWMTDSKLQQNEDKIEAMLFNFSEL